MKMIFVSLCLILSSVSAFAKLSCVTEQSYLELESAYRVRHNPLINYFLLAGQTEFQRDNELQKERDEMFRDLGNIKSVQITKDSTGSATEVVNYNLIFQNGSLRGVIHGQAVQFGDFVDCKVQKATGQIIVKSRKLGLVQDFF